MIDGDRLRRRWEKLLRADARNSGNNSQEKYFARHGGRMVMRKTAVVMSRSSIVIRAIRMGVSHAIRYQRDLRVLQGVRHRGHCQKSQASEPQGAETAATEHSEHISPPVCPVKPTRHATLGCLGSEGS